MPRSVPHGKIAQTKASNIAQRASLQAVVVAIAGAQGDHPESSDKSTWGGSPKLISGWWISCASWLATTKKTRKRDSAQARPADRIRAWSRSAGQAISMIAGSITESENTNASNPLAGTSGVTSCSVISDRPGPSESPANRITSAAIWPERRTANGASALSIISEQPP
ncbi:MAG: hypothetical protein AAGC86_11925 [Pseudomonadota bacterium]